jgi:uncharacterized protein
MIDDIVSTLPVDDALTPLEPQYAQAVRIVLLLNCLPLIIGAGVLDFFVLRDFTFGVPLLFLAVLAISAWAILIMPMRRLASWGYDLREDQLRIQRGVFTMVDTIVPFVRVQHIDVARGPIERMVGTATLTVHTAGNYNSHVSLPGLDPESAIDMRDRIRSKIVTDFE